MNSEFGGATTTLKMEPSDPFDATTWTRFDRGDEGKGYYAASICRPSRNLTMRRVPAFRRSRATAAAFGCLSLYGYTTKTNLQPIGSFLVMAGVAVGLFQALTSIQEMTLTFVPKLAAIVAVFWLSMSFMTERLTAFFQSWIIPLIVEV